MANYNRKRLFLGRIVAVFLIFLVAFSLNTTLISTPPVKAADWAGWDAIDTIYYDVSQEDPDNTFLEDAANELQTYLGQMAGRSFTITNDYPAAPALYLSVDAAALSGHGKEASRLVIDNNGIAIIGKTAFATRSGAYTLLDKLGVRWFGKHSIWWVVPDTLADLGATDEIIEPDYIWREVEFGPNPFYGRELSSLWKIRNLCGGPEAFRVSHSYNQFMPASLYGTYPDAYLPEGSTPDGTVGWQLKPDNQDVIDHAIQWARTKAEAGEIFAIYTQEAIPVNVISISPNDGQSWGTYDDGGTQALTDMVYGLARTVADDISGDYPEKYIGLYNYSIYSEVPTEIMSSNMYAEIATAYDWTELTDLERIAGLQARGINVGIREYFDITQWYQDLPPSDWGLKKMNDIKTFYDAGATIYRSEGCESWGSAGFLYWIAAKMTWDTSRTLDEYLDQYCNEAFGPAAVPMKRYHERWLSGQHVTDNSLACAIDDLSEAMTLASGNEEVLDRIRYLIYYIYYEWLYTQMDEMDLDEFAACYNWTTKLRDLYVLSFRYIEDDVFHDRLRDHFGMSEGEIDTWMAVNADYSLPTSQEAATWLAELQGEFSGIERIDVEYVNPYDLTLAKLNNTEYEPFAPATVQEVEVIVAANAGDTVNCELRAATNFDDTWFYWYDPNDNLLDSVLIPAPKAWIPTSFTASAGSGLYTIRSAGSVNVLSHPAGILTGGRLRECDLYFYVPAGTSGFLFEFESGTGDCAIYDPEGNLAGSITGPTSGYQTMGADNPAAGVWRLHYQPDYYVTVAFELYGIPDLLWHDPEYLLVSADAVTPAPPVLNSIGDRSTYMGWPLQFTISAYDPNGDSLTYSASNLPSWASFDPATRTFTGIPDQEGTYTNVHFEVSDGALTDFEDINITVGPSPGGGPDVNKDGAVNVLDMILVVQHWGESGASGWIPEDVNNDGTIDVLDITLIGQYWTG